MSRRGELIRPSRVQLCWLAAIQLDVNRAAKTTQAVGAERPDERGCIGGLQAWWGNWQHEDATMMMFTDECAFLEHTVPVISASLA